MKRDPMIYAQFAEILPNGQSRVYSRGRWVKVDPRRIQRAVRSAMAEEMRSHDRLSNGDDPA